MTSWVEALNSEMPAHAVAHLRYREKYRNAITLFECQSMDYSDPAAGWFEVPFARLRFTPSRGWELYWSDRNSRFHVYDLVDPTQDVATLLDEINRDPTCIFFG